MEKTNNYLIQAAQAKAHFLSYDQQSLIRKLGLKSDDAYLYTALFSTSYRIRRETGDLERLENGDWVDANTFEEVMTLLDLVCDSREDRYISGQWKNMGDFGLRFHRNLLENSREPWAERFQADQAGFCRACEALKGERIPMGDIAYAIEVFDGLKLCLQLWLGDEEFPPNLRLLWDAGADRYIRYETMYFARGLLFDRLRAEMEKHHG